MSYRLKKTGSILVLSALVVCGVAPLFMLRLSPAEEPNGVTADSVQGSLRDPLRDNGTRQDFEPLRNFDPARRASAVASDLESTSAVDVAREVLQLQQQLGGSVVTDRAGLQSWDAPASAPPVTSRQSRPASPQYPARLPYQSRPESPPVHWPASPPQRFADPNPERSATSHHKVIQLREAAWQLVSTAHGLEKLDLYDQADALRTVASRLRRDARQMKQPASLPGSGRSQFVPPEVGAPEPRSPKQKGAESKR